MSMSAAAMSASIRGSRRPRSFGLPMQKTTLVKNIGTKMDYKVYLRDLLDRIPENYHDIFMKWVNMELVKNMNLKFKKTVTMSIPEIPKLDMKTLRIMDDTYDKNDGKNTPEMVWLDFVRRATYRIEYHMQAK